MRFNTEHGYNSNDCDLSVLDCQLIARSCKRTAASCYTRNVETFYTRNVTSCDTRNVTSCYTHNDLSCYTRNVCSCYTRNVRSCYLRTVTRRCNNNRYDMRWVRSSADSSSSTDKGERFYHLLDKGSTWVDRSQT